MGASSSDFVSFVSSLTHVAWCSSTSRALVSPRPPREAGIASPARRAARTRSGPREEARRGQQVVAPLPEVIPHDMVMLLVWSVSHVFSTVVARLIVVAHCSMYVCSHVRADLCIAPTRFDSV